MKITRTVTTGTRTVSVTVEGPTAGDCIVALQEIWAGVEPPMLANPDETRWKRIGVLETALCHYANHDNWAHSRSQYAAHDRLDGNNDGWLIAEKALNPDC